MDIERVGELAVLLDEELKEDPDLEYVVVSKRANIFIFKDTPEGRTEHAFFSEMDNLLSETFKELMSRAEKGEPPTIESICEIMENNAFIVSWGTLEKIFEDIKRT